MSEMKSLAKDTAIYGLSSIIGKFLNYLLVPLYTYVLARTDDYGIVTNLYAWTALLLVILTYGMETGFFRFANPTADRELHGLRESFGVHRDDGRDGSLGRFRLYPVCLPALPETTTCFCGTQTAVCRTQYRI